MPNKFFNEALAGNRQAVFVPIPHSNRPAHHWNRWPEGQAVVRSVQDQFCQDADAQPRLYHRHDGIIIMDVIFGIPGFGPKNTVTTRNAAISVIVSS